MEEAQNGHKGGRMEFHDDVVFKGKAIFDGFPCRRPRDGTIVRIAAAGPKSGFESHSIDPSK